MLTLDEVKHHLRIDDDDADPELSRLIDVAQAECMRYTGLTADSEVLDLPDVKNGMMLMIQADYDGDPLKRNQARECAVALWSGHCVQFGV